MTANNPNNPISFLPDDYLERKAQRRASLICGVLFIMVMGGLIANMLFTRMVIRAGYLLLERRKPSRVGMPELRPAQPLATA